MNALALLGYKAVALTALHDGRHPVLISGRATKVGVSVERMGSQCDVTDWQWWVIALVVPLLLAFVAFVFNWVQYRLQLKQFYGRELFVAGSGLLVALHAQNNSHQGESDHADHAAFLTGARNCRDEVWRHLSQLRLLGSLPLVSLAEDLAKEYGSSSPDREDRKPIDRENRKVLRELFIAQLRRDCPGVR